MPVLHLCFDRNFVEHSREVFEEYYPNENIFVVIKKNTSLNIIKHPEKFCILNLYDEKNFEVLWRICLEHNVGKIVLHGCAQKTASILKYLFGKRKFTVYWLFWGYELYQTLAYEKGYSLIDEPFSFFKLDSYFVPNKYSKILRKLRSRYLPDVVMEMLPYVNYFCFWFKSDYDLLKRYFDVTMQYKFFAYSANKKNQSSNYLFELKERPTRSIMVNHQASAYGNHLTIFRKLKEFNCIHKYDLIVPLSYGSSWVRKRVLKVGKSFFKDNFSPVLTYMEQEQYFNLLEKVDVAIFGQRRQEASGNIIQLLKNGVKIFLRNDNTLLNYYRSKGYIIFSYEDDLKDEYSLCALSIIEKEHNRKCYLDSRFYYDDFMPTFLISK